ncbi:MAG TPA: DUF3566 domain-containing protein [Acidimicrobiia bacterium]|nr:DUF3566 domain-containing protein [Acidimicrobiia bacterium]
MTPTSSSSSRTRTKKVQPKTQSAARKKTATTSARLKKERSYRQMIGRIDIWSVLKVSLCFHTAAMLSTIFAMMVCWWVASAVGLVKNIEKFLGTVFEIDKFSFLNFNVLQGVLLIGLVFVALMTILSVCAAAFYNVFAEAVGGIEVYVVEESAGTKVL